MAPTKSPSPSRTLPASPSRPVPMKSAPQVYIGTVDQATSQPQGNGTLLVDGGSSGKYTGQWDTGGIRGKGTLYIGDGTTSYTGLFSNGEVQANIPSKSAFTAGLAAAGVGFDSSQ